MTNYELKKRILVSGMKNTCFSFFLLMVALTSCKKDELAPDQDLYNQVSGEWNIAQITFPANDSTVTVAGRATFETCNARHSGQCEGYFSINSDVVNFRYQVNAFSDGFPSKIDMGPLEQNQTNVLNLQRVSYDILVVDENHLTIDLAFCTYDTNGSCVTTHRYIEMTR